MVTRLLILGATNEEEKNSFIDSGATEVLTKPLNFALLKELIDV